ncbi:hypothetical protein [Arthrobacter sp. H5]|uniref:hypothetical protein n=1 Tax=Arthrobacter sp. H5 TaxID=1267973 RepID=UPI001C1E242F|nr:hypothetical protein [Arthrobacter sp. H5]
MEPVEYRVITVRQGTVRPSGSWLYVWVDTVDGAVAYVGATGFDPELRAHLHLMSDNPDHGRVRASVPHYRERDFDVLAFSLPDNVKRPDVKAALVEQLAAHSRTAKESAEADKFSDVTGPIIEALENYRNQLQQPSR